LTVEHFCCAVDGQGEGLCKRHRSAILGEGVI
jgi:hypothetical protein